MSDEPKDIFELDRLLEQAPLAVAKYSEFYELAVGVYPEIKGVSIFTSGSPIASQEAIDMKQTAAFTNWDENGEVFIAIQPIDDQSFWEGYRRKRPFLFEIIAEKFDLELDIFERRPELIPIAALAHEMGHAVDMLKHYRHKGGIDEWYKETEEEYKHLPIPKENMLPAYMTVENTLPYFKAREEHWRGKGIDSVERLMEAQEKTYRNLLSENYADKRASYLIYLYIQSSSKEGLASE